MINTVYIIFTCTLFSHRVTFGKHSLEQIGVPLQNKLDKYEHIQNRTQRSYVIVLFEQYFQYVRQQFNNNNNLYFHQKCKQHGVYIQGAAEPLYKFCGAKNNEH